MRKIISLLSAMAIIILTLSGCGAFKPMETITVTDNGEPSPDYTQTIEDGMTLEIVKRKPNGEGYSFDLKIKSDPNIYSDVTLDIPTEEASRCYLKHRETGEINEAFGFHNTLLFNGVNGDLSEYTLHIDIPLSVQSRSEYPILIPLKDSDNIPNALIKLPFDNFIKVESTKIRHNFDFLSEHCVDVAFTASEQMSDINMRVNKSKVNTGAGIGPLKSAAEHSFVYSHPINEDETEIEIAFDATIKTVYNFNCDIEL